MFDGSIDNLNHILSPSEKKICVACHGERLAPKLSLVAAPALFVLPGDGSPLHSYPNEFSLTFENKQLKYVLSFIGLRLETEDVSTYSCFMRCNPEIDRWNHLETLASIPLSKMLSLPKDTKRDISHVIYVCSEPLLIPKPKKRKAVTQGTLINKKKKQSDSRINVEDHLSENWSTNG